MFRSTSYEKYISILQKNQSTSQDELFMKPDPSKVAGMRYGSYEKLNERGFVPEETRIYHGDILIGKVSPIQATEGSSKVYKDNSETYKSQVPGVVDKVYSDIYNTEGYEMKKIRTRSERIPTVGDKFCFAEFAEALTTIGWVPIKDLTKEHKIACLIDNKYLEYVNPIDVYKFKYNGDMYKLRSQQVELDVTLDHQMYVKQNGNTTYECVRAKDIIGKEVQYKKWIENHNPDIKTFDLIEGKQIDMDTWLKFFGMWMAEGWSNTYNKNDTSKICYQTTICQCKPRISSILPKIATDMGFTYAIHGKKPDFDKFTISNVALTKYLEKLSVVAPNKSLPDWVWKLSKRQSRILLEHMILGDGHVISDESSCYYTSSKQLADDVMKLAIHAEWIGSVRLLRKKGHTTQIKERNIISKYDSLCVRIIKSDKRYTEPKINHCSRKECKTYGKYEEIYHYEGDVYCLEVPSHVFMMRQNGKNVLIGQCSRHGQL